ncbi:acyltransferase [uncultured Plantibacter sp.]|uniref:acyltransferase family protein n=1 Tax=uncultured Plantibacter sp. TaxID=293337 RepID=UPI0028D8B414|nr:acyltransferase [uncultured Plantibacter sp.]
MTPNSFTALRLIAAVAVLVRHSLIILDDDISPFGPVGTDDVPALGLWVFFVVSGFLLPAAWERRPQLVRFVSARVLRIFPGLVVSLLVTVAVIGLIASTLGVRSYLVHPQTLQHLASNLVLNPDYLLPGVFAENSYANAVNGALWSLGPLFAMYLLVPVVGCIPWHRVRAAVWTALLLWCVVAPLAEAVDTDGIVWGNYVHDILRVGAFFCAGAALREWRVPLRGGAAVISGSVLAIVMVLAPDLTWFLAHLAVPYVLVTIGAQPIPVLRSAGRFGDPSYGVFLIGFPVQQLLIHLNPELDWIPSILCTLVISVAYGYALWWFVDRPIAGLRVRPGRPARTDRVAPRGAALRVH